MQKDFNTLIIKLHEEVENLKSPNAKVGANGLEYELPMSSNMRSLAARGGC